MSNVYCFVYSQTEFVERNNAVAHFVDKRALYVVSTSDIGPQIYELVTETKDERTR